MNNINTIDSSQLIQTFQTAVPVDERLKKIARLYAEVFADPPWNEYKVCAEGHFYGREAQTICVKCDKELTLAYPEEKTVDYIAKEVGKSNGTLILFEDKEGDLVAAGWGYSCGIEELKEKYKKPEMKDKVEMALQDKGDTFFYLSEIMVDKRARNQGIATKISKLLQDRAKSLGWKMVMRTHNESPMAHIADNLSMARIIKEDEDSEIPGRVLFII